MGDQRTEVFYLDAVQRRVTHLGEELENELSEERVNIATSLTNWQDGLHDRLSCLVVGKDGETGDSAITVVEHVASEYPSVNTIFVAGESDAKLVERAYESGANEVVQYTGEETVPILAHHVSKYTAIEDAETQDAPPHTHLRKLVDSTDDAILTIDTSSEIRYATSGLETVLGYEPGEVVGESLTMLMSDEDAAKHIAGLRRYLETGERSLNWTDVELVGQHRAGHDVPLSVSFAETTVGDERYFAGIVRDISERFTLRTEQELLQETSRQILQADTFEEGLEIALQEVGEALNWTYGEAWVPTDDDERLTRASAQYTATKDSSRFASESDSISFAYGNGLPGRAWKSADPRLLSDVTIEDNDFHRTGVAAESGLETAYAIPISSDEEVVAVLLFMRSGGNEIDDRTIETTRAVVSDLDLLMRRLRAETELRKERQVRNRILDTNPAGIVVVDGEGSLTYANDHAQDILGLPTDVHSVTIDDVDVEIVETNVAVERANENALHQAIIESGISFQGEFQVDVHGERRWLTASGSPLRDESEALTRAIFTVQDDTERKRREHRLKRYEAVMQTVSDGLYALDDEGRFVTVNDAYTDLLGFERQTLIGEKADEFVHERVSAEAQRLQQDLEAGKSEVRTLETTLKTADDEVVPIEVRISLFPLDDDRYGRVGVVRDISERRRREERLAVLNEIAQTLTAVGTPAEVADIVVEAAEEALALPLTSVNLYDDETGQLESVARTTGVSELVGDGPLFTSVRDVLWRVYAENDGRVYDELSSVSSIADDETPLESAIVLPIGEHGVFVTGATTPETFGDTEVTIANILASNAQAALDRVDRERKLESQKERLQEKNESLERIERINGVIRNITQSLTHAGSRDEIERAVCEELADRGPYTFTWIAEQKTVVGSEVTPRAAAGEGDGYLDEISVSTDSERPEGMGPTGRAFRTHEPQVQDNHHTNPPFEPWRIAAIERDFRSSIAVPLTYNEKIYGVLNIYASQAAMFDGMEVAVLEELGEMVGYAINAMERKKMLVSDTAVALEFELDDPEIPAIRFARETGGRFEFNDFVQRVDGGARVFFTISNVDPETVYEFSEHVRSVDDLTFIGEQDDSVRFEATMMNQGFFGQLVSHGAYPKEMSTTDAGARVEVELPRSSDIQSFIRMFLNSYENAELVARQERDRPVQTRKEFEAVYKDALTMRQEEVLKTAYVSGFFEWPREKTGQEIAAMLDVSQPTVNRHIRNGERKLMNLVFDDN